MPLSLSKNSLSDQELNEEELIEKYNTVFNCLNISNITGNIEKN